MYSITKWCKSITNSGKDEKTNKNINTLKTAYKNMCGQFPIEVYKFRLLDDDGIIYAYGLSTNDSTFAPLDKYESAYGCTEIQYYNKINKKWETL